MSLKLTDELSNAYKLNYSIFILIGTFFFLWEFLTHLRIKKAYANFGVECIPHRFKKVQ